MKKVAIYARVSTEHQTSSSLETQIKACKEYCARHGWIVADVYQERDSGGKVERQEFQKMIAKALNGAYDVIVVEKFDRFFRDDIEDRRYTRMLEEKGVLVVSALEGIDTTSASGKLLRWILSDINWFQREYMKEEQMRKTKEAARQGYWLGGIPPLGYKVVEVRDGERKRKKLEIDPETVPVVQRIFELFADGYSYRSIVKIMNKEFPFRQWKESTIYDIVHNPKYLGIYTWNVPRRKLVKTEAGVVAEGVIPPIITGQLAEKVKERLSRKKASIYVKKHTWLLSGVIYCGLCGNRMEGCSHPRVPTYRCRHGEHEESVQISKQYVETYVITYIKRFLDGLDIEEVYRHFVEYYSIQLLANEEAQRHFREQLEEIERKEKRLVEAIMAGIDLETLREEAERLKKEKEEIQKKIQEASKPPSFEEVKRLYESLKVKLNNTADEELLRNVIKQLVKEVKVFPGRVVFVDLR
ncbi:recombinase family protein [Thermotoga sp. SG1]|uniref:recombinase family protein n=1 Tax=Thermotoga sp. SG1 TaxID=126739 RepID=UPI000C793445|nr:recombinase family protein [Thermotoga sp. SG1]PLV55757.1 hypothetical protein AS006_08985 [Thermotoga sp. SG1]